MAEPTYPSPSHFRSHPLPWPRSWAHTDPSGGLFLSELATTPPSPDADCQGSAKRSVLLTCLLSLLDLQLSPGKPPPQGLSLGTDWPIWVTGRSRDRRSQRSSSSAMLSPLFLSQGLPTRPSALPLPPDHVRSGRGASGLPASTGSFH